VIEIYIGDGCCTLIDDADIPLVIGKAIRLDRTGKIKYARVSIYEDGQKEKRIRLHRFLLSPPSHMMIDHANGDTLDNRRSNLRICTQHQNVCNTSRRSHSRQRFKGVHALPSGRYAARIGHGGRYFHLGSFDSDVAAAVAYNEAAARLHGEFCRLKEIPETEAA
jgi:hypothetical protein